MNTIQSHKDVFNLAQLQHGIDPKGKGKEENFSPSPRGPRPLSNTISHMFNPVSMEQQSDLKEVDESPVVRNFSSLSIRSNKVKKTAETSHSIFCDILKEKCFLSWNLRSLYNVLCVCISDPKKNFRITEMKTGYQIHSTTSKLASQSIIGLSQVIRRSVDHNVKGVFSDHGRWVGMGDFLEKIKILTEKNKAFGDLMGGSNYQFLEETVAHFKDKEEKNFSKEKLSSLKLPDFANEFPENEKIVVKLLQRIYPGSSKSKECIDPVKLILVYHRYLTTERFFELIRLLLLESEERVPTIQKYQLLNLCRTWVSRKYHPDQILREEVEIQIQNVIDIGLQSGDLRQVELAYDLSSHMARAPFHVRQYRMVDGECSLESVLKKLSNKNLLDSATKIASDCYEMSRATVLNIPLYELLIKKAEDTSFLKKSIEKFERLSNFVRVSVLDPADQLNPKKATPRIQLRIKLWIEVADRLLQKGEFSLSLAVFSGLNKSAILRLVNRKEKWDQLNKTFSPAGDFKEMKKAIRSKKEEGGACVPHIGLHTRHLVYANDGYKDVIEDAINVEKLHVIAGILSDFWKDLSKLRSEGRKEGADIQLETNLMACLEKTKNWDDDYLWELSGKIKPFKEA